MWVPFNPKDTLWKKFAGVALWIIYKIAQCYFDE
jgi:hypothetical protein